MGITPSTYPVLTPGFPDSIDADLAVVLVRAEIDATYYGGTVTEDRFEFTCAVGEDGFDHAIQSVRDEADELIYNDSLQSEARSVVYRVRIYIENLCIASESHDKDLTEDE